MRSIVQRLLLMTAVLALAVGSARAAPRSVTVANETLGDIQVVAPLGEPRLFVVYISGSDGLTEARRAEADRLTGEGAAVALVDLPDLRRRIAASDDEDCHYTFGDFEDLARVAQRELHMTSWRWPVTLGIGDGGALAYLAMAQAPDNTAGGAVSIGFANRLAGRLPLCEGALATGSQDGIQVYAPPKALPASWRWIAPAQPAPELASFADASPLAQLRVVPGDADAQFRAAMAAAIELGTSPTVTGADLPLAQLPLVELPTKGKTRALVVFISGDGGWRDIDKQIGEYLAANGVGVIGIDTLRYFWSPRQPEAVAADLDRIVAHYQQLWQVHKTALAGYSFGADILPLAWGKLRPATREATDLVALLSPEPTADLEVSVSGWLGLSSSDERPVRPYLAAMPAAKVMCVYGEEEQESDETACTIPELPVEARLMRPGGHHYDGNYQAIADAMLARLAPRTASTGH